MTGFFMGSPFGGGGFSFRLIIQEKEDGEKGLKS